MGTEISKSEIQKVLFDSSKELANVNKTSGWLYDWVKHKMNNLEIYLEFLKELEEKKRKV